MFFRVTLKRSSQAYKHLMASGQSDAIVRGVKLKRDKIDFTSTDNLTDSQVVEFNRKDSVFILEAMGLDRPVSSLDMELPQTGSFDS